MKSFLSDIGNTVFVVGILALQFLVIQFIYTAVMGYLPDLWTYILVALIREYQRLVQDSQTEVKKKELELTDAIIKDMRQIVEKIGEDEGYTLVIERTGGMVLYSKKDIDLTDVVIKRYNQSKK